MLRLTKLEKLKMKGELIKKLENALKELKI